MATRLRIRAALEREAVAFIVAITVIANAFASGRGMNRMALEREGG
jgi:hypothetical protein